MKRAQERAGRLLKQVKALRAEVIRSGDVLAQHWRPLVADTTFRKSAENLAHYLSFRSHDLRSLQEALTPLGVSSLGRCEAHVLPTLEALIATLGCIAGDEAEDLPEHPDKRRFAEPFKMLAGRSLDMLGKATSGRDVRILVTLPTDAAVNRAWVRKLIEAGADCVRINCAHDGAETWAAMIENVRASARDVGRTCRVLMDLTGPRARTEEVVLPDEESRVHVGDRLLLCRNKPVARARFPFQTRCSLPEVFTDLKKGRIVCFNEARIRAEVERITPLGAELCVVGARPKGEKFRPDMALNFPGTDLHIPPLTDKDLLDLDFVVRHADLVGYSFVQRPEDISVLLGELDARRSRFKRKTKLGIVAKIETDRAVRNLPEIIVRAAGRGPFGVMIARGDLSVEVGFRRVAELQEEILWLCEAAHVPVIWATQVLETLAKKGVPTRAEITDAAMAERAECVMLNKGPFIMDAVRTLDSVLSRMAGHHRKKSATLRALHSWEHLFPA